MLTDRTDMYPASSNERSNGFRDVEQPSSPNQRDLPGEADPDTANLDDTSDRNQGGNPESIQAEQRHQQQPNAGLTDGSIDASGDTVSTPQEGDTATDTNQKEDQGQAEEEQYSPGFPKKMEVVVLALVRQTVDLDSDWVTELPKGTIVQVVEIVGRRARISHPFPGWLSIRTGDGQTILTEPDGTVRVGARIVYKDFHKKASLHGTVIEKDDRRSLHLVQFHDGRKDWLNLNCKEVEIVSTGRGEEITQQVKGATRTGLNYFAEVFVSNAESNSSRGPDVNNVPPPEMRASPPHPGATSRMPANGYTHGGGGHPPGHLNGATHRSRHGEDYYGRMGGPSRGHHGMMPDGRAVDPRYPGTAYASHDDHHSDYPRRQYPPGSSGWGGRSGHDAPPGLQPRAPMGHRENFYYPEQGYTSGARNAEMDETHDYGERSNYPRDLGPAGPEIASGGGDSSARSNVKGFIVLRGLPGAGKTTLAKKLASRAPQSRICTEDRYHWTSGEDGVGEYKFKREVLFFARDWCNKEVKNSVQKGVDLVILDNCNARISMYEDLINFAVQHKYRFRIIEFIATPDLVDKYAARSLKGFPREVYLKLLKLWESDPRAELINPCFDDGETAASSHSGMSGSAGTGASGPSSSMTHRNRVQRDAPPYYNQMEMSSSRGLQAPMMGGPPVAHAHQHSGHSSHGPPPHVHSSHRHHGHGGMPYETAEHGDYMQHYY